MEMGGGVTSPGLRNRLAAGRGVRSSISAVRETGARSSGKVTLGRSAPNTTSMMGLSRWSKIVIEVERRGAQSGSRLNVAGSSPNSSVRAARMRQSYLVLVAYPSGSEDGGAP